MDRNRNSAQESVLSRKQHFPVKTTPENLGDKSLGFKESRMCYSSCESWYECFRALTDVKHPDHVTSHNALPAASCLGLSIQLWPKMLPNTSKKLVLAANALFLSTSSPNIKPSYDY